MTIYQKLNLIQKSLEVPKEQLNKFGGYYYRSCADILEKVKPLLSDQVCLTLNDELVNIGDRVYIKATATLYDVETKEKVQNSALAREPLSKKGQDESQITGSTSSYARKYALNGLFCIDDIKDSDATNTHDNSAKDNSSVTSSVPKKNPEEIYKIIKNKIAECSSILDIDNLNIDKAFRKDVAFLKEYSSDLFGNVGAAFNEKKASFSN